MLQNYGHVTFNDHWNLKWNISAFSQLPSEMDFAVESPEFSFNGADWCLQMYPNGTSCCNLEHMAFVFVKQDPFEENHEHIGRCCCNRKHVTFVLFDGRVKEIREENQEFIGTTTVLKDPDRVLVTFPYSVHNSELQTDNSLKIFRSEVESIVTEPDGDLIVHCWIFEESEKMLQNYGHVTVNGHWNFEWKISAFSLLPTEVDFMVESPEFSFNNVDWCLQMHPNGMSCCNLHHMVFALVRQEPCDKNQELMGTTTILKGPDRVFVTFAYNRSIDTNKMHTGNCPKILRSEVEKVVTEPDGDLVVHCWIYEISGR